MAKKLSIQIVPKYVIWTLKLLNTCLIPPIAIKQTFIMFLQSCEKSWRKTSDPNVLKKHIILVPQVQNRLLWSPIENEQIFVMSLQSYEMY